MGLFEKKYLLYGYIEGELDLENSNWYRNMCVYPIFKWIFLLNGYKERNLDLEILNRRRKDGIHVFLYIRVYIYWMISQSEHWDLEKNEGIMPSSTISNNSSVSWRTDTVGARSVLGSGSIVAARSAPPSLAQNGVNSQNGNSTYVRRYIVSIEHRLT